MKLSSLSTHNKRLPNTKFRIFPTSIRPETETDQNTNRNTYKDSIFGTNQPRHTHQRLLDILRQSRTVKEPKDVGTYVSFAREQKRAEKEETARAIKGDFVGLRGGSKHIKNLIKTVRKTREVGKKSYLLMVLSRTEKGTEEGEKNEALRGVLHVGLQGGCYGSVEERRKKECACWGWRRGAARVAEWWLVAFRVLREREGGEGTRVFS